MEQNDEANVAACELETWDRDIPLAIPQTSWKSIHPFLSCSFHNKQTTWKQQVARVAISNESSPCDSWASFFTRIAANLYKQQLAEWNCTGQVEVTEYS